MNPNKKIRKNPIKHICINCNYKTSDKKDFEKHCMTDKHKRSGFPNESERKNPKTDENINLSCQNNFVCKCGRRYKHMSTLCNHQKKCESEDIQKNVTVLSNLVIEVLNQNQEFQKLIIEQNRQIIDLSAKTQIVNNNCTTTNTKFNLQFFLNETCKDAMNIMEFVDSMKLQLSDLETIGNTGFVDGISNIIIKNLKDLDITKRPLHCTDSKREILYVKDEDKWEKENEEKDKLKMVINQISHKNIQQIPEWIRENPQCKDNESLKNIEYLHIINESMGCSDNSNYNKIIHNISKEVAVDK